MHESRGKSQKAPSGRGSKVAAKRGGPSFPASLTSFVGREDDAQAIARILRSGEARLLTLTGPGGVGKTRLALRVAADLHAQYADGAYFVGLASVANAELMLPTVAAILGVPEVSGMSPLASLCAALGNKQVLLVLDNLEQIVSVGPLLVDLLQCAPGLHVLATSRALLHVYGESEYPVLPLALPDVRQQESLEQLTLYEAVRLFIERARGAAPGFTINNASAPAVAEICHRLDGLPLAIELAAARIRFMSPQALLRRLDRRLPMLTYGATDLPRRHRTLRDAISWSYDLLSDEEKNLFRSVSVFRGGFSVEAAQAILQAAKRETGSSLEPAPQLDDLLALADKSLLRHDEQEDDGIRFSMLETIQEFAAEELSASGSEAAIRDRHAHHFLALVEQAEPELTGSNPRAWLDRLELEHDNLRAALEWALQSGDAETGLRMAGGLFHFWYIRGHFGEGRKWLSDLLSQQDRASIAVRTKALNSMGNLSGAQSDYQGARGYHQQVLALSEKVGNKRGIATALTNLGNSARLLGEYDEATALFERALHAGRELEDKRVIGLALHNLSMVQWARGQLEEAHATCDESLRLHREIGAKHGIALSLHSLGQIAISERDFAGARTLFKEVMELARELSDKAEEARALQGLGETLAEEGDYKQARELMSRSLRLNNELGTRRGVMGNLRSLAIADRENADPRLLVRLLAAADSIRTYIRAPASAQDDARVAPCLQSARSQLGSAEFARAWQEGTGLSVEQAVQVALDALAPAAESTIMAGSGAQAPSSGRSRAGGELTAREVEVLGLVAAGLTNPGIAAHLHVSINTVQTHLRSIFNKINVNTRSAAVRYAFEHNLR